MNFFFFLNHDDSELQFECDIFNFPSAKHLSKYDSIDRLIIAYYSDGIKWHSKIIGDVKSEESLTLNKNDLPGSLKEKSVIFGNIILIEIRVEYCFRILITLFKFKY